MDRLNDRWPEPLALPTTALVVLPAGFVRGSLRIEPGGNADLRLCRFGGRQWFYKRYRDGPLSGRDADAVNGLVRWRRRLPSPTRDALDRLTAWPRYVVTEKGRPRGVLLPVAPRRFFRRVVRTARTEPDRSGPPLLWEPRMVSRVIPTIGQREGRRPGWPLRVGLNAFGRAAVGLLWLHEQGVTAHDVRGANLLCTSDGAEVYFVDCDVMVGDEWGQLGPDVAPPMVWEVVDQPPSPATDLARLAWSLIWAVGGEFGLRDVVGATRERLLAELPGDVVDFLSRATDPGQYGPDDLDTWRRLADQWSADVSRHERPPQPSGSGGYRP